MRGSRPFIALFLAAALVSGILAFIAPFAAGAIGCNPTSAVGVYLAYCNDKKFADYEHGAYYLGLEPRAIEGLRSAQVVVVGSSLSQIAFSTEATRSYFHERGISYHLLGFGYREGGQFPTSLLAKHSVRPKLVIIHGYAFFEGHLSTAAESAMTPHARWDYLAKKVGANFAAWICADWRWLCGSHAAIYRQPETGAWDWDGTYYSGKAGTVPIPTDRTTAAAPTPEDFKRAEQLAAAINVPKSCIIVTTTPIADINLADHIRQLGEHIGATVVLPDLPNLMTFDRFHLDKPSAERWSKEFFKAIAPAAARCENHISMSKIKPF